MTPDYDLISRDLIHDEGLELSPYYDTSTPRKLTIGVGRCLDTNPLSPTEIAAIGHDGRHLPITKEQALYLLANDIKAVCGVLDYYAAWWSTLGEVRARCMVELCFNMGWGNGQHGLSSFHNTLGHIQRGEWEAAADGLLASKWAIDVKDGRADRIADMVRYGKDISPVTAPVLVKGEDSDQ